MTSHQSIYTLLVQFDMYMYIIMGLVLKVYMYMSTGHIYPLPPLKVLTSVGGGFLCGSSPPPCLDLILLRAVAASSRALLTLTKGTYTHELEARGNWQYVVHVHVLEYLGELVVYIHVHVYTMYFSPIPGPTHTK